jgi:hypothetical protein
MPPAYAAGDFEHGNPFPAAADRVLLAEFSGGLQRRGSLKRSVPRDEGQTVRSAGQ